MTLIRSSFGLLLLIELFLHTAARPAHAAPLSPAELKARRHEAAWKKRRVIMNNDGNEPYLADFVKRNPISDPESRGATARANHRPRRHSG
jgi:hypothetical protein